MRLDKFLSDCRVLSRKESARAVRAKRVRINDRVATSVSQQLQPEADTVFLDGKEISFRKYVYVMLNKPAGYVSATEDSQLPCVTELLSDDLRRFDPFPCGRLDRDTLGLMLLTNDGELSHSLLSPRRHVTKKYRFSCERPLCEDSEELFHNGITLADGYECKSAVLEADPDRMGGYITLSEGKYHQIKRMLCALDNRICELERVEFASLKLDPTLKRGEFRILSEEEISELQDIADRNNSNK